MPWINYNFRKCIRKKMVLKGSRVLWENSLLSRSFIQGGRLRMIHDSRLVHLMFKRLKEQSIPLPSVRELYNGSVFLCVQCSSAASFKRRGGKITMTRFLYVYLSPINSPDCLKGSNYYISDSISIM